MPDINKANREVADVSILEYKTKKPFLDFDTANTTTAGFSSDAVHAKAKGKNKITYYNPLTGTMKIEAQVRPFKFFSLFSDGTIENSAIVPCKKTVKCTTAGSLTVPTPTNGTIMTGTVFTYPEDSFADEDSCIEGTFATNTFTATTASEIEANKNYTVSYLVNLTGVKRISINNKKMPKDYYIFMKTVDKGEDESLTTFILTAYKATIQRNFEFTFNSEGDPGTVSATFDCTEDDDRNVIDMTEAPDGITFADDVQA